MTARTIKRRWKIVLLKLCCSCLLFCVLLEMLLRLAGFAPVADLRSEEGLVDLTTSQLIEVAERRSWIHRPSTDIPLDLRDEGRVIRLKRNAFGCREDSETPVQVPNGTTRVLVIGDSHTDGAVINRHSYANVLEARLGTGFDVVNCGQGAKSPYQLFWVYKHLYSRFNAQLLVVGVYAGNDLLDLLLQHNRMHLEWNGQKYVHSGSTGRPDIEYWREADPPLLIEFLTNNTATFRTLQKVGWISNGERILKTQRPPEYFDALLQAQRETPAPTWQGLNQAYFFKHYPDQWSEARRRLRYVLEEFEHRKPPLGMIVLVIPSYRQFDPTVVKEAATILGLDGRDLDTDVRACDTVLEICRQLDIDTIDLRPAFKSHGGKLYWDFDHHINRDAHALIAEVLYEHLHQAGLASGSSRD